MARVLRRTVITGGVTYPPGTRETAELRGKIPNPRAWDGESEFSDDESDDGSGPVEPPRSGRGSGEDAWREYALGLGIEVPADAGRDDIIALVDAR